MLDQNGALLDPKGKGRNLSSSVHKAAAGFDIEPPQMPGAADHLTIAFINQGLILGARGTKGYHTATDPSCAEWTSLVRTNVAKRIESSVNVEDSNA